MNLRFSVMMNLERLEHLISMVIRGLLARKWPRCLVIAIPVTHFSAMSMMRTKIPS